MSYQRAQGCFPVTFTLLLGLMLTHNKKIKFPPYWHVFRQAGQKSGSVTSNPFCRRRRKCEILMDTRVKDEMEEHIQVPFGK